MKAKNLLLVLTLFLFSSCSGTYKAYYQTLKIAFSDQKNAQKTLTEVQQSEVDIISVKRGDRSTAIMALAYLENGQHKWVSNDNAMLIIQKGRLVRTLGLSDNRIHLSNLENDPLKFLADNPTEEKQPKTWLRIADREGGEYGYPISSTISNAKKDTIQTLSLSIDAKYYVETVSYDAPTNYFRLNNSWKNHFWYSQNGVLIKSIQQISPLSEPIEIIYLSRISRLN